jgi:hypothetical protein
MRSTPSRRQASPRCTPDAVPAAPEGPATVLAMLDERRSNLTI